MPDPVSRERIVAAARALVEADGPDALSMRKLAAELGVAHTAIYWHVGSREAVLNAVLDSMIAELPPLTVQGTTPRRRLASAARSILEQVRATEAAHQLARLLGRTAELSLPGQIVLAREVGAAGVKGPDAAKAVRALSFLVGGFILLEDVFAHPQQTGPTTNELWATVEDPAIPAPLRRAMEQPPDSDVLFDFAVDRLVASILPRLDGGGAGPTLAGRRV